MHACLHELSKGMVKVPVENDLYIAGIIFWSTQKKSSRGCLRVRPDANTNSNPNHSKTICRSPLKGVNIITQAKTYFYIKRQPPWSTKLLAYYDNNNTLVWGNRCPHFSSHPSLLNSEFIFIYSEFILLFTIIVGCFQIKWKNSLCKLQVKKLNPKRRLFHKPRFPCI